MNIWSILIICILFIIIIVFGALTLYKSNQNIEYSQLKVIYPFSATTDYTGNLDVPLTGTDINGNTINQIQCPAGYNVNILGAFIQVNDPYNECSVIADNVVNNTIKVTCGTNSINWNSEQPNPNANPAPGTCSTAEDCYDPTIFDCVNNKCQLKKHCGTDEDCFEQTNKSGSYACVGSTGFHGNGYCVEKNVCLGVTYSGPIPVATTGLVNPICTPSNKTTQCAIRDASAYLAKKCNGINSCQASFTDFGPLPCQIQPEGCGLTFPSETNINDYSNERNNSYCQLPFSYGVSGVEPQYGSSGAPPSVNIGYSVHGIFNCVKAT